ncbi:MAG: glycosyltransferase family 2 protein [Acidobacteriota bacterium]|nr:glycosyltransferase family 2 protein [Acidobacteriota bacterium]
MMPRVSVIIATRNRCALLARAVESARRAGRDVEIIVVDDASTDQTPEVCRRWADVHYKSLQRSRGLGGARNVGLIAATAPFITFLDDDDFRLPGSLDAQVELLEAQPASGMIYGRALYGDGQCQPKGSWYPERCPDGDIFWELLSWNFIPCPTVVFRRACLTRIGLLEEEAPGIEDWDLWVRIAELYPVIASEKAVAVWRQPTPESGQFTSRSERLHQESRRLHRDKWLHLPRALEAVPARRHEARRLFSDRASQQLVWEAAASLKAGRAQDLARVALAAARMYPVNVSRKILSASTWLSLMSGFRNWRGGERTCGWHQ